MSELVYDPEHLAGLSVRERERMCFRIARRANPEASPDTHECHASYVIPAVHDLKQDWEDAGHCLADGREVPFEEFAKARLWGKRGKLVEFDRKERPDFYDRHTKEYDPQGDRLREALEDEAAGGRKAIAGKRKGEEGWLAVEPANDPTADEALDRLEQPQPRDPLIELTKAMTSAGISAASQPGVLRFYEEQSKGNIQNGRQAGKALGRPGYFATGPHLAAQELAEDVAWGNGTRKGFIL
jgi:hypothetical protein